MVRLSRSYFQQGDFCEKLWQMRESLRNRSFRYRNRFVLPRYAT